MRVSESFETESSLIAYGRRDTESVVLKVVKAPGDEWRSGEVARAFRGRGVVRVLESVEGAALLERIEPGTPLVELTRGGRDDDATEIIATVIASMSPSAAPPWCPKVYEWGRGFDWYLALGDAHIPRPMVERARAMYSALCETLGPTRLLHGDLQHYNVLADRERGWLAIDPKGVVGDVEYELGAALRNPGESPDVFTNLATIERRVTILATRLACDADRIVRWAFAQGVLSAIWDIQDGYALGADNGPLALARAIDLLLGVR